VVAFTHAGVIQVLLCRLLGLSPGAHRAFGIRYASVATVELCDGTGVLTGLVAAPAAGDSDGSSCDG
jgi:broad specificity phosphatase PhoE